MNPHDDLAAKARAATPGPWRHWTDPECPDDVRVCYARDGERCDWCVALAGDTDDDTRQWTPETLARWRADADFIAAASPSAVLALLADLRAARARVEQMERVVKAARACKHRTDSGWRLPSVDEWIQLMVALDALETP
jgi:hypothetical protein